MTIMTKMVMVTNLISMVEMTVMTRITVSIQVQPTIGMMVLIKIVTENFDYDQDGDGEPASWYGGDDCNDLDPTILSTATEVYYDGVDQNCDGLSDYDADGDGQDAIAYGGADCDDTDHRRGNLYC